MKDQAIRMLLSTGEVDLHYSSIFCAGSQMPKRSDDAIAQRSQMGVQRCAEEEFKE